jgi:predicted Rossmann-fold nucleotide-binding protein
VPIVLFGTDYWQRLVNFEMLVDEGVISRSDLDLFSFADEAGQAWESIRSFYGL